MLSKMVKNLHKHRKTLLSSTFLLIRNHADQANKLIAMFTNHCATLIQKHFRRYIQQKYYRHYKRGIPRMRELINAMSLGWKTRRIMKTRIITRMIEDIKKKEQ
jgi:hypothetical protein